MQKRVDVPGEVDCLFWRVGMTKASLRVLRIWTIVGEEENVVKGSIVLCAYNRPLGFWKRKFAFSRSFFGPRGSKPFVRKREADDG
jgi:hypothetical protein